MGLLRNEWSRRLKEKCLQRLAANVRFEAAVSAMEVRNGGSHKRRLFRGWAATCRKLCLLRRLATGVVETRARKRAGRSLKLWVVQTRDQIQWRNESERKTRLFGLWRGIRRWQKIRTYRRRVAELRACSRAYHSAELERVALASLKLYHKWRLPHRRAMELRKFKLLQAPFDAIRSRVAQRELDRAKAEHVMATRTRRTFLQWMRRAHESAE
jgi:hypothetical protein